MKMQEIKQEVLTMTCTIDTQHLQQERPDLTKGRDLRYKVQWLEVFEQVKALRFQGLDISLIDLEQSEQILKDSLFKVGRMAGLSETQIQTDWQRIKLEAQFGDLHIEELP